jgi:site-specific recombinase XerD
LPVPTAAGTAALAAAQALARKATSAATLRAYRADWTHFSQWCATHGFVPVPAAPATVGAYLASLADSHAPTTLRRRLAALGKMHRFNGHAPTRWGRGSFSVDLGLHRRAETAGQRGLDLG